MDAQPEDRPEGGGTYGEAALLGALARGDRDAMERLVRRYSGPILGYLYHFLRDFSLAQDLTQETFVRLYKRWHRLRWFPRSARSCTALVFKIAANLARDEWRRRNAHPEIPFSQEFEGSDSGVNAPDAALERKERQNRVWQALRNLPEKGQQILIWREMNGLSYEEIAEIAGLPLGTVKSRMARARLAFKDIYMAGNLSRGESVVHSGTGESAQERGMVPVGDSP